MTPRKLVSHPPTRPPRGIGHFSYRAARWFTSSAFLDRPLGGTESPSPRHVLTINLGVRQ